MFRRLINGGSGRHRETRRGRHETHPSAPNDLSVLLVGIVKTHSLADSKLWPSTKCQGSTNDLNPDERHDALGVVAGRHIDGTS
jgi:hypothetical protein